MGLLCLMFLFVIPTAHGSNPFFDTELYKKMAKELDYACEKVDICNRNSSESKVRPNGIIGSEDTISCCKGCSCDERCHENLDCCFPGDDGDATSIENKYLPTECITAIAGEPAKGLLTPFTTWPAYRMITSAPRDGCIPSDYISTHVSDVWEHPSCGDEAVASWGNLFPVYSKSHDTIYKNARCALCHNSTDAVPWIPLLVCVDSDDRRLDLSELLEFLEQAMRTSTCFVTFQYQTLSVLESKRCFRDLVSTCTLSQQQEETPNDSPSNISVSEIKEACESGLVSPVTIYTKLYKNVFCFYCDTPPWNTRSKALLSTCSRHTEKTKSLPGTFLLILDPAFFKKKGHAVRTESTSHASPEACAPMSFKVSDNCRNVVCPAGQMSREGSGCVFVIKRWEVDAVVFSIKLSYPAKQDKGFYYLSKDIAETKDIRSMLMEKTPWVSFWTILQAMHTSVNDSDQSLMLTMTSEVKYPTAIYRSIKNSMAKPWPVALNGTYVKFEQSVIGYSLTKMGSVWIPHWKSFIDDNVNRSEAAGYEFQRWQPIMKTLPFTRLPRTLTKLFTCAQISLQRSEFDLYAGGFLLNSTLTTRILYDQEFEIVYEDETILMARVCLSDTVFKPRSSTNGSKRDLVVGLTMTFGVMTGFLKFV